MVNLTKKVLFKLFTFFTEYIMQPLCMFKGAGDVQLEIVLLVSSPGSNMCQTTESAKAV